MKRRLRPLTLAQWQRATHEEAEAECRAHNMRLCTARELVDGACCDTACPLDVAVVWTGDECAAGSASTVLAEHPRSRAFDRGSNSPNVTLCPKHQKPRRRPGAGQGADPELRGDGVKRGCGHGGRDLSRCVMKHGVPVNSAFTSRARGHGGSLLQLLPDWEVDTGFFVFRNLVDARSVVLDIGGWIGLTASWFANVAKQVVVLEPTNQFSVLRANLDANRKDPSNIVALQAALSTAPGSLGMTNLGTSMDHFVPVGTPGSIEVEVITIDLLVSRHPFLLNATFVKIDTEGHELVLLPALRGYLTKVRPTLFVSIHPGNGLKNAMELSSVEDFLLGLCPHLYGPMDGRLLPYRVYRRVVRDHLRDALCMWAPAPAHMMTRQA